MDDFFAEEAQKLSDKCINVADSDCLIWTGKPHKTTGYGQYRYLDPRSPELGYLTRSAQRMAVMIALRNLDIPQNLQASHLCHNKLCVNVEHISLEENATNNQRKNCVSEQRCTGHGDKPACILSARLRESKLIVISYHMFLKWKFFIFSVWGLRQICTVF